MLYSAGEKIAFIETVFGKSNVSRDGRNVAVRCPICMPRDATKRKLVIRTSDDACHCWVCGFKAKTLAPLLRKFSPYKLEEYKSRFNPSVYVGSTTDEKQSCQVTLPNGFRLLATAPEHDHAARLAKRYVLNRGLSEGDLWRYKFGVADEQKFMHRVIMPSFTANGELNYYVARAIGRSKPKYVNSDVPKTSIIFNELDIDWSSRLVICEGAFDLVKCGDNATALLGSELSEEYALFNMIIIHNTPVALALDSDMVNKRYAFAKKLTEYDIDVSIVDFGEHHDPGEMSKKTFSSHLNKATKWNWYLDFNHRLENASQVKLDIHDSEERF